MAGKRSSPQVVNLDALTGNAVNLRALAGDEMMQDALALVRARLGLTAESLASMLIREFAPDWVLRGYEEEGARGVSKNTLGAMKQRGELPQVCGGVK